MYRTVNGTLEISGEINVLYVIHLPETKILVICETSKERQRGRGSLASNTNPKNEHMNAT